jgi:hypothetical protein
MTFKELADAIAAMSPANQGKAAIVWPPQQCPAAESVQITELAVIRSPVPTLDPLQGDPVLLTGKPLPPQPSPG